MYDTIRVNTTIATPETTSGIWRGLLPWLLLLFCLTARAETSTTYTVGVVPQLSPLTTHKAWAPFVERLTKDTGVKFELKIYDTIPKFEVDVLAGALDFAFMNPYHQLLAMKAQGYIPLIRDVSKPIYGIVLVKRNGDIKNLQDLNGKELVFPAPNAYAASLYIRGLLSSAEGIEYTPRYLKNHSDVYRQVILGKAAAGGGVNTTLERESSHVQEQLRTLYQTPASAPHPFSAHPRVPKTVRQSIQVAILALATDPVSAKLLRAVQLTRPIAANYEQDYLPLEKLGLENFIVKSY